MPEVEEHLSGGNASQHVVRLGSTVRKPWLASTPSVHRFMRYLREHGLADVPRPMGRDSQGRQVTEFVSGRRAPDDRPLPLEALRRVGHQIRQIHDIAAGFEPEATDTWTAIIPAPGTFLICHNDLAPWNLVMGAHLTFIDWDGAGPSTRLWDLAYAAQSFGFLVAGQDPHEAAQRLRTVVVDGYQANAGLRSRLAAAMGDRTQAMYDFLRTADLDDFQPWGQMFRNGQGRHWDGAARFVRKNQSLWHEALTD